VGLADLNNQTKLIQCLLGVQAGAVKLLLDAGANSYKATLEGDDPMSMIMFLTNISETEDLRAALKTARA
jgi:hypothetical protein